MPASPSLQFRGTLLRLVLIALIAFGAVPAMGASKPETQLYIGHRARLTTEIPSYWLPPADRRADYAGVDGFVGSSALIGSTLDAACHELAAAYDRATTVPTTWRGENACEIAGEYRGEEIKALVLPYPQPFTIFGQSVRFVAIAADPAHFPGIIASLSFDPGRVTPEAFSDSVLDLMEARAYWSGEVDWAELRESTRVLIDDAQTLSDAHIAITQALATLRSAGDNHSFVIDDPETWGRANEGFGMLVEGHTIALVYPESPAGHAGLRTGDRIESIDGQPLPRPFYRQDPGGMWLDSVEITIRRPGVAGSITVTLTPGSFDTFSPPTVDRVNDQVGYVELFTFASAGREREYASAANEGIARVDDAGTCGWIVDLRRDQGGSYSPMVTGVGSILGEGTILTWVFPDGTTTTVTYREGSIVDDGVQGPDLVQGTVHEPKTPNPPIAVLIGPWTASSGEATTLAFVGRPDTRLFGATTAGYMTGNSTFVLFDGSAIALATVAMADRTGETHLRGITPDELAGTDWSTYGTVNDPVIQEATAWLERQLACTESTPVSQRP